MRVGYTLTDSLSRGAQSGYVDIYDDDLDLVTSYPLSGLTASSSGTYHTQDLGISIPDPTDRRPYHCVFQFRDSDGDWYRNHQNRMAMEGMAAFRTPMAYNHDDESTIGSAEIAAGLQRCMPDGTGYLVMNQFGCLSLGEAEQAADNASKATSVWVISHGYPGWIQLGTGNGKTYGWTGNEPANYADQQTCFPLNTKNWASLRFAGFVGCNTANTDSGELTQYGSLLDTVLAGGADAALGFHTEIFAGSGQYGPSCIFTQAFWEAATGVGYFPMEVSSAVDYAAIYLRDLANDTLGYDSREVRYRSDGPSDVYLAPAVCK